MSDDQNNVVDFVAIKSLMHRGHGSKTAVEIEDSWRKADPGYDKGVALTVNLRQNADASLNSVEKSAKRIKETEEDAEAEHQEWLRQRRERRKQDREFHERSMRRIARNAEIDKKLDEALERELRRPVTRSLDATAPYISPSLDPRYIEAVVGKPDPTSEWVLLALAVAFIGVVGYLATHPRRRT